MSAALLSRPCRLSVCLILASAILCGVAAPAAAQPSMNVPNDLGTFGIGEIQWALVANGGDPNCTWTVTGNLPPGVSLRTDVPSWHPGASAILMGIATTPETYAFTLSATCGALGTAAQATRMTITSLRLGDPGGLPSAYAGEPYTYTFTGLGNGGDITWALDGAPLWLSINAAGVLSGTPPDAGYYNFSVTIAADGYTVMRGFGLYVHPAMHITSATMPNATRGVAYTAQVAATGGTETYTFAITGGGLPNGLTMDAAGAITGTPDAGPGRYHFQVTATDTNLATHVRDHWMFVVATPAALPSIQPHGGRLDDCTVGVPCAMGLYVQNGGVAPFTWVIEDLPDGFWIRDRAGNPDLAPGEIEIVGAGATAGSGNLQVTVTGADHQAATQTFPFTVSPLALRTESTTSTIGLPFSSRLFVLGGTGPYAGAITAGPLPAGLTFDEESLTISGTPLESGGFHVDFRVSDTPLLPDPPDPAPPANTLDVSQHYHVNETANISINMGPDLGFVTTGWEYRTQLWACCAPGGYEWTVESGTLPAGMGLTTEGELSGTPTNPGVYTFLVRATENGAPANTTLRQLTIRVTPLSIVMDTRLATGFTTTSYSAQLNVEGAAGGVTWEVAYNSYLPPGLSLENSGGVWTLSGTPTASGQYDFSLTVRDSTGHPLTRGFSVSVYPFGVTPPVQVNLQPNLGTWSVGDVQYALSATGGDGTYVWSIVSGALPTGVSLRADVPSWYGQGPSGLLMGVATAPGVYAFTLRASSGGVHTDQACTMTITALRFTDRWWPPHAFVNEAYSFALTAAGNAGPLVWSVGGSLPPGLSLTPAGVITGTPTAAGHYWFNIGVTDGQHAVNRGFQIDVFDVHLTTDDVPGGAQGATYSLQFTASGGTAPYTFTYQGQMPAGLSLSSSGLLSGVIASYAGTGRYNLTVSVADSLGRSYSRNYALLVRPVPPTLPGIEEHGGSFDDCTVYVACSRGVFVWTGSVPPLTWQVAGLPPGLSLATTPDAMNPGATMGDAEITGVPTTVGDYLITITVTDASGASATQLVPLRVSPMGLWYDNVPGTVGVEYSAGLFVAGGLSPYSLAIVSGKLPEGLTLDGAGRITGTPLESGGFGLRLRATDAAGETLLAGFHINIGGGASTITVHNYWDLGTVITNGPYSNQLSACCAPAYEWSLVSGELPPGMSLTTGGLLTGTPTLVGTYNFVVQAAESGNPSNVGLRAFRLVVTPITISMNTTLPTGFVDTEYTVPLAASGGSGSIAWQVAPFHLLPPGLSLAQAAGTWSLAGTPAASGLYSFELIASDGTFAASRWFTVSIYPAGVTPPVAITMGPDFGSWSVGEVQAALYAEGGNGTYAWTLVGGELPPGLSLRADVPPWFGSAKAGIMGIATVPGPYTFTLRVTSGTVQFERTFTVRVTSLRSGETLPLPDAYVGQPYAYTLRAEGATGQVSWALDPGAPVWVGLTGDGVLSGTPPAPGWYHIPLQVSDAVSTIHISVGVQVNSVRVTSGLLPNAVQNQTYSAQVEATGGVEPYTFELNGGLPYGLTMDAAGGIGGSCNTGPGRYPFDVTVRDAAGASHRRTLAIYVTEVPASLPMFREHGIGLDDCTVFVPCQRGFWVQNGGTAPFTWSATGLPPGLSMRTITTNGTPGDGEIVGVPTATGTYFVNVTVTGADLASSTQTFPLTVSPLAVRPDSTNPTFGQPFETKLRVLGGTVPYTGTIVTGDLPAGLSFNGATGVISGTPLDSSGTHVVYRFTDGLGQTVTQGFGLHVSNAPGLWINSGADLGYPLTGSPYNNQLWACCAPGYVWSAVSALPPGLTLSSGGLLTGTPTAAGTFAFLVSVADATNLSVVVTRRFTMTVTPLSSSWAGEPTGNVNTAYSLSLGTTGATGAITWTVAPFSYLPPGLSLVQVGGAWTLSGTPTASGQYGFNLLAQDEAGHRSSLGINVSVYPEGVYPPVRVTQWPSLGTWSIGDFEHPLVATGGDGTYTWQVQSGTLPPGLSLRARPDLAPWFSAETTGSITGIATVPGTYTFTLRVTSAGSYADQACSMTITNLRGADNYRGTDAFVGREYAYQLQALGDAGPVTFTTGNSSLPPGLSMNAAGLISGEPEVSGYYHIDYSMSDGVHTVGRWVSISVFDVAIDTPGHLPNALQNAWYSTTIAASGGTGTLTFTQNGGLPGGLTLSAAGVITGTVNAGPGHYGFNVTATDANHVSYTRRMAITVVGVPKRLAGINPNGSPWNDCTVGVPCTLGLYIHSGGVAPFAWSATGLPDGMSIRTAGPSSNQWATPGEGEIFGVPSAAGTFDIEVSLTDADGAVTTNTFAMRVSPLMARDFDGSGTRGEPFEAFDADPPPTHYRRIRVTGGKYTTYPSYTATILSGRLPAGLTLDPATQTVSGTPLENGSFGITLEVRDTANPANILVTSQGLWIGGGTTTIGVNNNDLGVAAIGQPFSYQLGACCIPTPYLWSVEPPASMPAGLGLDSSGRITGTPTGPAGTATFLVRAADSTNPNNYGIRLLTLTLVPSVISVSTNVSLPFANVGVPYEQALVASGGPGALTWSVEAGSFLPPGLTLAAAGGLSGTPTTTGSFRFSLRVTSTDGSYAVPTFTLEVYPSGQAPPLGLNIGTSWTLQVGVFTTQLTQSSATGGVGPYTFSLTPEVDLPPGAAQIPGMRVQNGGPYPTYFSPSATAGYMGVVAEPGLYHPSLRVTDSRGVYADQVLTVSVQALTILSQPTLPRPTLNVPYFFAFEPHGGTTYAWSATNLPSGLTIDAVSGELTGTPSASGSFFPSITLTDLVTSASVSMGFTLVVDPFAITTGGVLPPATSGVPYSLALSAPGCGGGCTWALVGGGLTGGLSLNATTGVIAGTPTPSGPDHRSFTVRATGSNGTSQKVFSLVTSHAAYPAVAIPSNLTLMDVTVGQVTSAGLFGLGGAPPYTWTLASGTLPTGVTLVSSPELYSAIFGPGTYYLRGKAMEAGTYVFTLRVTDQNGSTATRAFTWHVSPLSFQYNSLPVGSVPLRYGEPYSQPLLVIGGTGEYPTWTSLTPMPAGLVLNPGTGVVTGTPAFTGTINATIRVTDSEGHAVTRSVSFNVAGPTSTTLNFASGSTLGPISMGSTASFNVTPSGQGSTPPYTVTAVTPLPPGFTLVSGSDGVVGGPAPGGVSVMGVATTPGTFFFTLEAQDSAPVPNVGARTFALSVYPFSPFVNTTLPDASVGTAYEQPLVVFDNTGPASWSIVPGSALPPGLSLVSGSLISGTPSTAGTYSFALVATDASGLTNTFTFTMKVSPITIAGDTVLPAVTTGAFYSYTFVATGAAGTPTWTATGVPSGLTFSSAGVLSGTRTSGSGSVTLVVTARDGLESVTRPFLLPSILPNPGVLSVPLWSTALSDAVVGQNVSYNLTATDGVPPYAWSVAPGSVLPPGLQVVAGTALIGWNPGSTALAGLPSVPGDYVFDLVVTDAVGKQARRTFTLRVTPIGLIGNTSFTVTAGTGWTSKFIAVGGTPPYVFSASPVSWTQDMLPPGFALSPDGVVSGVTSSTGGYNFLLCVVDAAGLTLTRQVTVTVNSPTLIRVLGSNPGDTWVGGRIRFALNAADTTPTTPAPPNPVCTWSVVAGSLPPGVSLIRGLLTTQPNVTYLSGVPSEPGVYTFTVRATMDAAPTRFADHAYTFKVGSTQMVSPPWALPNILDLPSGEVGAPYTFTFKLAGGRAPYTFQPFPFDPLPPGLALSADGVLSGTPVRSGSYSVSTLVTDADGHSMAIGGLTLIVVQSGGTAPLIRSGSIAYPAAVGVPYGFGLDIMLRGGTPPFVWSVASGSTLPPGLHVVPGANGVTAYLAGRPTTPGPYTFQLTVADAGGQTLTTTVGLTVSALALSPDPLPPARVGVPYAQALTASGGTAPYVVQRGSLSDLPPGLSFAGAVLSGTPTTPGIFVMQFTVTDALGTALTRSFPVFVDNAAGDVPTLTLSPRPIAVAYDVGTPAPAAVPVAVATTSGALPVSLMVGGIAGASLSATTGTTPVTTDIGFSVSSLAPGIYTGLLAAAAPAAANLGDFMPVTLTVCGHTLFPQAGSVPSSGGQGTFNVASGGTCAWTATASATWITITGGASGTGNGTVSYSVASNASADPRTGTITIGGATYTITQFGSACTYTVQPAAGSVPNTGGAGAFAVSTNGTCAWTAVSSAGWLTVTGGGAGVGNATVTYSATANTSPDARSATVTVNGALHTVTQFGTACSFAISPAGVNATAAGGMATVLLSASSSQCAWSASSSDLGVTPTNGMGSAALQVAVPSNPLPQARWLTATIAGQPFTVYQTGIDCVVTLSSSSASVPAGASAGSVDVTTPAGCSYDTVPGPSWITVTAGGSGVGNGTLSYTVEPNSTTYSRTGSLTIGGQGFTVTQAPLACSVTLNTSGLGSPFGPSAATGLIALTANGANCSWTASSDVPWASVTPAGGSGNRTLTVSVTSNAASTIARTGALTIAGQTVGLSQAGTACTYALESTSASASASGGSASVRVIAPSVCGWTASSQASWLTITSSGSAGTSAVSFVVAPNPAATPRTGTLTVAGLTYTVEQAGAPCSYSITGPPASETHPADGAPGVTFGFTASAAGCAPTAVSYASWITVTATTFGGTTGSVTYAVAPNPFGTTRTGTILVGNALFTVTQSGASCAYSLNAYGKVFRMAGGADTLLGSATASVCSPVYGTDQPSFITLGDLTGPVLNIFSLPYSVSPFNSSLTAVVRTGRITFGGQILTIKQLSW